jgi:cell division protein FtsL
MKKLNILDAGAYITSLHVLFYYCLVAGFITMDPFIILIGFFTACLMVYRDDILKAKSQPIDELKAQLDDLQSEVSSLKLHEGIKTLK